ncbi:hypothetical protein CEXT_287381 [Caerostris extrusa]|uniref:Uncharacterized protein n=1 Tax=Caerostris extrusa TaxID=172846 RepID=A0AAV4PZ47_CAEEX|nr:hypothetical protein CEXT_287381 [Caerostris extrusa]
MGQVQLRGGRRIGDDLRSSRQKPKWTRMLIFFKLQPVVLELPQLYVTGMVKNASGLGSRVLGMPYMASIKENCFISK